MRSEVRLVVCINERLGSRQRSCVGSNNLEYIGKIRSMIEAENLSVPIIERICLGKCEQGPVMRIAPGGRFFTEITEASLRDIIGELKTFLARPDKQRA
jgi:(2Fe-2S) ferredoxin